jgi:hypothetical protein
VTSTTVTLPSGLTDGDYTIIFVSLNASTGWITTPSGWTDILASTNTVNGSTSGAHAIFYRKWQSGDTDPDIATKSGRVAATPVKVSGADATTFVNTAAVVNQNASGVTTITASSITPSSTTLVCSFMGRHASNGVYLTPFGSISDGMTTIAEANGRATGQTNAGHCIGYQVVTADTATGTREVNAAQNTTGAMGVSFALNEAEGGGGPSNVTVSPTGIASAEAFGSTSSGGTEAAIYSTFDDGTRDGWTESITGNGTTAITSAAAHDGPFGASSNVPATSGDRAALTRSIGPSQSATIRGWWKVTTEGSSSSSNVPFARLFNGSQRLADVYRQNQQAGANVWLRVVEAAGGSNYTYIPTGYTLPVDTWVYVSFTWGLDGIPHLFIDGVEYLNESDAPADFYAATQIDTAWLGSQESGNQGAWAIDSVDVISQSTPDSGEIRHEPILTGETFGSPSITISDPPVDIIPPGIASAEAFGTPTASTTLTVSPSGVATAGAIGAPSVTATLTASPTGIATAGAFGTPSLSTTLTASPAGVATAEAFGAPTVTATLAVVPTGIATAGAFGSPSATAALTASPAGIASVGALGSPTVAATLTASPAGIVGAEAVGSPAVTTSLTASPGGIATGQALGAPALSIPIGTSPDGIASAQAMGSPTIGGNLNTFPPGVASGEAFGSPSVSNPLPVNPVGIATAEAFGTPDVALGAQITPPGIASAEAVGSPAVSALLTTSPAGVDSSEGFGSPTIQSVLHVAQAGAIATAAAFGSPTISEGGADQTVSPAGIPSAGAFGVPFMTWDRTATPASIGSLEAFGTPRLSTVVVTHPATLPPSYGMGVPTLQPKLTASPAGIPSQEAFGVPALEHIVLEVGPTGLSSREAFGAPRITGGSQATPIEMVGALLGRRHSGKLQLPGTTSQTPNRWEGSLD